MCRANLCLKRELQERPGDVNLQQMCELNGHEVVSARDCRTLASSYFYRSFAEGEHRACSLSRQNVQF